MANGSDDWYTRPGLVLAWGAAASVAAVGVGYALKWIIQAIFAGVAVAGAILTGGIAGLLTTSSWIIPAAGIGIGAAGITGGVVILVRTAKKVSAKPYEWALPVLSILAGFSSEVSTEIFPSDLPLVRLAAGSVLGFVFFLGGLFWARRGRLTKLAGLALFLLSPIILVFYSLRGKLTQGFWKSVAQISLQERLMLGAWFVIVTVAVILAFVFRTEEGEALS